MTWLKKREVIKRPILRPVVWRRPHSLLFSRGSSVLVLVCRRSSKLLAVKKLCLFEPADTKSFNGLRIFEKVWSIRSPNFFLTLHSKLHVCTCIATDSDYSNNRLLVRVKGIKCYKLKEQKITNPL